MAKTTWILIANSSQARLFKSEKPYHQIELLMEFAHPESRLKVSNLVSDGYGRVLNRGRGTRASSYEEPTNPKQVEAIRFAQELAQELNLGRAKNQYHNLILVIPAQFRGLLNKYCSNNVINLVEHAIDKDYTKFKQHELVKLLNNKIKPFPLVA